MRTLFSRLAALLRRRELDARLDQEVQAHLDELTAEYVKHGATPEQGRLAARRAFGGVEQMKEVYRDRRSLPWADALRQDVFHTFRQLRQRPALAITAVITLSTSMAAAIAVFAVVNGVALRPLTYPDADRLVVVHSRIAQFGRIPVSEAQYSAWRESLKSVDGMALLWGYGVNLSGEGEPARVPAARVSAELFEILGARPQLGRLLREEEEQPGRDRVVVVSDALWRGRFNADRGIVGRTISVNGEPHEVVGVLPADFRFPRISRLYSIPIDTARPEVWKPLALAPNDPLSGLNFAAIGRLSRGATIQQAQSELDALQRTLTASPTPGGGNVTIAGELTPLREHVIASSRRGLEVLLAAVGAVLLIACLNVTNLMLSRSAGRARELAVRSAIGATRGRLARQLFTEGVVLSLISSGVAVAMADTILRLLVGNAPIDIPRLDEVRIDGGTLLFAAMVAMTTALIVGLLPAWRLPDASLQGGLKGRGPTTNSRGVHGTARTLIVGQLGATTVCAMVAGLLLQSLVALLSVDKGFEVANIVTADVELAGPGYAGRRVSFERLMLESLQGIQGVTDVGLSSQQLLSGTGMNLRILAEGTARPVLERPLANFRSVNPGFFRAFGIPIYRGQAFSDTDIRPVAVISESTAARLWPGENAVGKRFRRGPDTSAPIEVVGVAADVRATRLDQPAGLIVYLPFWQAPPTQFSVALRTPADPQRVASAIRDVMRRLDPTLPVGTLRTMRGVVADSVAERRFLTTLVALFAAIASLLAAMGVYGVISQRVTQRTTEIGLRVALGAQRSEVVRLVLHDAWLLAGLGVGIAVPIALLSGSALRTVLFGVTPYHGGTMAVVSLTMVAIATVAAYAPARRASRVDAMTALRAD